MYNCPLLPSSVLHFLMYHPPLAPVCLALKIHPAMPQLHELQEPSHGGNRVIPSTYLGTELWLFRTVLISAGEYAIVKTTWKLRWLRSLFCVSALIRRKLKAATIACRDIKAATSVRIYFHLTHFNTTNNGFGCSHCVLSALCPVPRDCYKKDVKVSAKSAECLGLQELSLETFATLQMEM